MFADMYTIRYPPFQDGLSRSDFQDKAKLLDIAIAQNRADTTEAWENQRNGGKLMVFLLKTLSFTIITLLRTCLNHGWLRTCLNYDT